MVDIVVLLMVQEILDDLLVFLDVIVEPHELFVHLVLGLDEVLVLAAWLIPVVQNDLLQHDALHLEAANTIAERTLYLLPHRLDQLLSVLYLRHLPLHIPHLLVDAVDILHLSHLLLLVHARHRERVDLRPHFEYPLDELRQ